MEPAPAPTPSRLQRLLAYRLLLLLAVGVLILDQLAKTWIAARLAYGAPTGITVIPNFFYLVHVGNTGAAWSLFTGQSVLLGVLAAATLVAIALWRHTLGLRGAAVQVSFGLLCGGITGNLVDRLRFGHVIDFLEFHFGSYIYPIFNVADSAICLGVILYLWWSLRHPGPEKR